MPKLEKKFILQKFNSVVLHKIFSQKGPVLVHICLLQAVNTQLVKGLSHLRYGSLKHSLLHKNVISRVHKLSMRNSQLCEHSVVK